jgi:outer membrane protein TolC
MKSRSVFAWWAARYLVMILFAAVSCAARPAFAAPDGITIEDVVARVLAGHPEVERGKQRVMNSEGKVRRAKDPYDWRVFADGGYQRKEVPDSSGGFLTTDTQTNHVVGGTAGVSKQFESGITVTPGYSFFYNTDSDATEALSGTRSQPNLKISVPMLRFWRDNPSAANLKAARIALGATRLDLAWKTQHALQKAALAFWEALAARGRLEILTTLKKQTDDVDSYLKALLDRGQLALSVYQRAAANRLYRSMDMDSARAAYEKARSALAVSIGIEPNASGEYPVPAGQFPVAEQGTQAANGDDRPYIDFALEARPDLLALDSMSRAEGVRLKGARNDTPPKVDLNLALDQVFVRYVMSLGNSGAEGRLLERKAAVGEARLNADILRRRVVGEVKQAFRQLRLSERAYHTAAEANRLLEMVATDVDRRTKMGVATPQDRLATFERVADAQQRFVRAARDYAAGIAELRLATSNIPIETATDAQGVSRVFLERPGVAGQPRRPPSVPAKK